MTTLACSLTPGGARERAARWRRLLDDATIARTATDRGAQVRLRSHANTAAELDALVAAEAECCPFLALSVRRSGAKLVLDVTGEPEAQAIIAELVGAPAG
jgi:MerR family transcriptional regulator, copper efflux regulator